MNSNSLPRRALSIAGFFALLLIACCEMHAADPFEDFIRKTDPLTPEQERLQFHLPPGFEVQLVASEPDIGKPMNMAFDAQGRLWLTQSREYPYAAPLDKPGRDMIKVLSDFDARGRARKVTTFAEGLNIPIGLYPYKNGVIAFSIPYIYFFQDTDGDGRSDKKDLILGRFGFERDVHGLTSSFRRGYDGWVYADHGYNNDTKLTAKDGSTITMNSGNTYRFRIDGSHVEQFTHGQVNPFGLMFDQLGDLWSADCHSSPVYQLLRDAWYPSFGKPHDGIGFGPDICDHSHSSTAIAGMVNYCAEEFPQQFRGNTFIGNVMTCRIDRDSFVESGSTRVAKEEPDFLSSDDPWFRPVDLQLGPDGAIYVADFYNRIIGHYEVPLDHPGRDRERGRIWRIVYRGTGNGPAVPALKFDVSQAGVDELIRELANPNITRRMLAMNQIVDRIGGSGIPALTKLLTDKQTTAFQRIHGLWALSRLSAVDDKILTAVATDADRGARVHAMRVLSETPDWNPARQTLALNGLSDSDAYVQRAAADALTMHPAFENIRPLLDIRQHVPGKDEQLLYVVRLALRAQLRSEQNVARLQTESLSEVDSRNIADVLLGVSSEQAGAFLAQYIQKYPETGTNLTAYLRHAIRHAPSSEISRLAEFARTKFSGDLDFQLALFKSIQEGAAQRGSKLEPAVASWGANLADQLLESVDSSQQLWRNSPIKGKETTNPWHIETHASSDGKNDALFFTSLSPGGEKYTGVLRSKPFVIPARLSFFMAGHDGPPGRPPIKENFFLLRDATSGEILAQSAPPRNDVAQPFHWNLTQNAGKQGVLQIVDNNTGSAYAWLAVGRFEPEVAPFPGVMPAVVDKRVLAGAELAGDLKLAKLEPRMAILLSDADASADSRGAATKALVAIEPSKHLPVLGSIVTDASQPLKLREKIALTLGELNSPAATAILVQLLQTAPASLETQTALALASNKEGAEGLLQAVADGKASARLLQNRNIKDRLTTARPEQLAERLEKLTANLPKDNLERQKRLDEKRSRFTRETAVASRGADVFKQNCAVCHSLDGQGALIGPQLDGVGGRGADRLFEDILDPSRNVDRAFRTTLYKLKDGDVQSGLFRREEGEVIVLADSTGKEMSIPRKDVVEKRESETSLMPDNFADLLPTADLNNLMAFLLEKNRPPAAAAKSSK